MKSRIAVLSLAASCLWAQPPATVSMRAVNGAVEIDDGSYAHGYALVEFQPGAEHRFLPGSGPARGFPGNSHLFRATLPRGVSVAQAVARYKQSPNVRFSEPDYVVHALEIPVDPMWPQQWDMSKIAAPQAWATQTDASDVVVAVIDTGIDSTHPDLTGNVIPGYTCMNGSCVPGGQDDYGHGTHCAGTIGAVANNGRGIAGVNWRASMVSIKFLNTNGSGLLSDAVLAFHKVLELKRAGMNIRVTSNSWGGGPFMRSLYEAMLAVEAEGIVNVCAAGNNGQNADQSPMYPAAYDNRGIISVLATDSSDAGAYFTNYGLASTDIAAPGVNTLSTVPTGGCPLCDASGYKLLSGTSMATPHVSGVAAALLHQYPNLSAAQARDVILDPLSYDAMTETRAVASSTGGRLNFAKVLANPQLPNPKLNGFPTLVFPQATFATGGQRVDLTFSATDPDGDILRSFFAQSKQWERVWFFGSVLYGLFPANGPSFNTPLVAHDAVMPYVASIADGRGGGATGTNYVTVLPSMAPRSLAANLDVSNLYPEVGDTVTVRYQVAGSIALPVLWYLQTTTNGSSLAQCCYSDSEITWTFNRAGVYRVTASGMDKELNRAEPVSLVVHVGGALGSPPTIHATQDRHSGEVPLTVNVDLRGSHDEDGSIVGFDILCAHDGEFVPGQFPGTGACVYDRPGDYWIEAFVFDNEDLLDIANLYVVVTPKSGEPPPPPPPPPVVLPSIRITAPADGSTVPRKSTQTITATGVEGTSALSRVEFSVNGAIACSDTITPYVCFWKVPAATNKTYRLQGKVYDSKGAAAVSPIITVIAR